MKKILIGLSAVIVAFCMVSSSFAATQTTGNTLASNVVNETDLTIFPDYSDYPGAPGQVGRIVRFYDYAVCGGASNTTINLIPANAIKNNTVIRHGYIKIMRALVGTSAVPVTNSIGINSTNDILALGTNIMYDADTFRAITPTGAASTFVQLTNDLRLTYTTGNTATTNGRFMVVLDVEMAP